MATYLALLLVLLLVLFDGNAAVALGTFFPLGVASILIAGLAVRRDTRRMKTGAGTWVKTYDDVGRANADAEEMRRYGWVVVDQVTTNAPGKVAVAWQRGRASALDPPVQSRPPTQTASQEAPAPSPSVSTNASAEDYASALQKGFKELRVAFQGGPPSPDDVQSLTRDLETVLDTQFVVYYANLIVAIKRVKERVAASRTSTAQYHSRADVLASLTRMTDALTVLQRGTAEGNEATARRGVAALHAALSALRSAVAAAVPAPEGESF